MSSLLEAILAQPDDDDARLVYADSLLEQGDPRGELIAVQVQRARLERDDKTALPEYRAARKRERELLKVFPHGLQSRLATTAAELRARWVANEPITTLELSGLVPIAELRWLAKQPNCLRTIAVIAEDGGQIELDAPTAFASLTKDGNVWKPAALPHASLWPAVTAIRYGTFEVKAPLLRAVASAELPRLRRFGLTGGFHHFHSDITAAVEALVTTETFAQLEELEIKRASTEYIALMLAAPRRLSKVIASPISGALYPTILGPWVASVRMLHLHPLADHEEAVARLGIAAPKLEALKLFGIPFRLDPLAKQLRSFTHESFGQPGDAIAETPFERLTDLEVKSLHFSVPFGAPTLADARFIRCHFDDDVETEYRARFGDDAFR